ncbi:MAG: hypothetical protein L0Z50_30370 [Verrucomicrobiales bacterium]|nr:hypothetical protein [Verrucomicrobiales bacterium]
MKKFILGSVIGAVVLFFWGFIFWGTNPLPYSVLFRPKDEAQLGAMLREQLPSSGTYVLPHPSDPPETLQKLSLDGPIAMIHLRHEGRSPMEPRVFAFGFLHGFAVVLTIGMLMTIALPALPSYSARVRFATLFGIASALFVHAGSVIWMNEGRAWHLVNAIYEVSSCFIIGLVLGAFLRPAAVPPN